MLSRGYTYDDVCLVPSFTNVESRLEPDLSSWLTKNIKISIPLINAPMDSVISFELADILLEMGTIPIFHRSPDVSFYERIYSLYTDSVFVSVGVNNIEFIKEILDLGFNKILLDTANGWTRVMLKTVEDLKKSYTVEIIAGNVCTGMGYVDLVNAGADCVRVGVGGGAACSTRIVTAVGVPQFTAIQQCAEMAKKFKVPFIADGGIKGSREICLALSGGATTVMVGKLLALTEESAAKKRPIGGEYLGSYCGQLIYKEDLQYEACFRGQASENYQIDHYGKVKEGTVPEGVEFWSPVSGQARKIITDLIGGLRSSMTYLGAKTIKEYQAKAEFMEVTSTYSTESNPRPN